MRSSACLVPSAPFQRLFEVWSDLEARGCERCWIYCNVIWRERPDDDLGSAMTTLTALVMSSSTMRGGLLVVSPNVFHPVVVAKDVLTLSSLSGGRVDVVLGSGSTGGGDVGADAGIMHRDLPDAVERHERFSDFVEVFTRALEGAGSARIEPWDGRHYHLRLHRIGPASQDSIELGVAADASRGMAVAHRVADNWVTALPTGDDDRGDLGRLERRVARFERIGPASSGGRRTVFVPLHESHYQRSTARWNQLRDTVDALGFDEIILHVPRPHDPVLHGPSAEVFSAEFPLRTESRR